MVHRNTKDTRGNDNAQWSLCVKTRVILTNCSVCRHLSHVVSILVQFWQTWCSPASWSGQSVPAGFFKQNQNCNHAPLQFDYNFPSCSKKMWSAVSNQRKTNEWKKRLHHNHRVRVLSCGGKQPRDKTGHTLLKHARMNRWTELQRSSRVTENSPRSPELPHSKTIEDAPEGKYGFFPIAKKLQTSLFHWNLLLILRVKCYFLFSEIRFALRNSNGRQSRKSDPIGNPEIYIKIRCWHQSEQYNGVATPNVNTAWRAQAGSRTVEIGLAISKKNDSCC